MLTPSTRWCVRVLNTAIGERFDATLLVKAAGGIEPPQVPVRPLINELTFPTGIPAPWKAEMVGVSLPLLPVRHKI